MTKSERGIFSEWRVAQDRIERFDERLLCHRERTPCAEIDLLFIPSRPQDCWTLIEVKSWNFEIWRSEIISRRQVARLERARFFLQEKYQKPIRLLLAVVSEKGSAVEIRYFEDLAPY